MSENLLELEVSKTLKYTIYRQTSFIRDDSATVAVYLRGRLLLYTTFDPTKVKFFKADPNKPGMFDIWLGHSFVTVRKSLAAQVAKFFDVPFPSAMAPQS